ncbi:MAG: flavin reductase family protein [Phycisphaerales bacterium]|nr:MAG: flavin reductase family protein [Phycisphaerales bacterium]
MEIDPAGLKASDRYKLLIGCIVPRPIAFVSTVSPDGKTNLAPYSFFNGVGSDPMTLLFCPANDERGQEKDSLRNAAPPADGGIGQFVVNIARDAYAREVSGASEPLPYGQSEFDLVGLTPAPSSKVRPPRVAESPVAFECETMQIVRTNPGVPAGGNIVIGRVVHVFVDDRLINERYHTDPEQLDAIGRMGGLTYCRTRDRFDLPRGKAALDG